MALHNSSSKAASKEDIMNEKQPIKRNSLDDNELLNQVEKAISTDPVEMHPKDVHPTIQHGETLAMHLESVMAEYSKRVATAADLIRRTVKQLADDQIAIEQHLNKITKGCDDISKVGNHR